MTRFPREDYRSLSRYAPDRRPVRVDLSDNTNLWGPHPAALEAVRAVAPERISRYPVLYADDLRDGIAARYGVPADNICTGCGSDDVLDAAFRAAGSPRAGGGIRYPAPTFSMVGPFARINGRPDEPVPWPDALRTPDLLLEGDPAVLYLCRPNNPTGHRAPRSWMDYLFDRTRAMGERAPVIVVDEAYAEFDDESITPEAPSLHRVLSVRTFSKAYGLAGLRVGWAAGSREMVDEVEKSRGPYKVNSLAELAATRAVQETDGWLDRTIAESRTNRDRLVEELRERGMHPFPSHTNFVLVCVAEGTGPAKARELRELGVAVRPFTAGGDALRVSIGPWPLMEAFLEALDEAVRRDPPAWETPDGAERVAAYSPRDTR